MVVKGYADGGYTIENTSFTRDEVRICYHEA